MAIYWIVLAHGGAAAVITKRPEELEGLVEAGGSIVATVECDDDAKARRSLEAWSLQYLPFIANLTPGTWDVNGHTIVIPPKDKP